MYISKYANAQKNRREFLIKYSLIPVAYSMAARSIYAQNWDLGDELTDLQVKEILIEEGEPGFSPRAVIENYWFEQNADDRIKPTWPGDHDSFDYHHIKPKVRIGAGFELNASVLKSVVDANSISLSLTAKRTVIGLRGCALSSKSIENIGQKSISLVTARPDHINLRCLIGVWDRDNDLVSVFKGSTVPNSDLMLEFTKGGSGCNMMPTGLHSYQVGPHRGWRQPGALRQVDPLWVIRSRDNLTYSTRESDEVWDDSDGRLPYDNIHAAIFDRRSKPPFFSSAGCQVVAGSYKNGKPIGPWAEFRSALNLRSVPEITSSEGHSTDDGRPFDYMLLTGDEVALAANSQAISSLKFGSSGEKVKRLQRTMGFNEAASDGLFGRATLGSVIKMQKYNNEPLTGIVVLDG